MKKIKKVESVVHVESIDEILCDCCGQNIKPSEDRIVGFNDSDNEIKKEYDYSEYLTIKKEWGYNSNRKDGEIWEAHVCEKCVDNHLSKIVLFNHSGNMFGDAEEINDKNKINTRKRKIRTINEDVGFKIVNNSENKNSDYEEME